MRERAASPVAPTDVLYADSDGDFASLVERSLTRLDPTVSVEHVTSAESAFESVSEGFDCVVSAYTLRDTDAVSFLKQFRRQYPDLPFVLFTGAGSETVAADAIAAGVSAYVPVRAGENNFELLAQRIWTVTQGYRAEQRAESVTDELQKAYQRTDEAVVAVDPDWRIIFSNDTFATQCGVERQRISGVSLWEAAPELDAETVRSACRSVIQTGEAKTVSTTTPDDSRLRARIFPDEDGGVVLYLGDVTDRWRRDSHTAILRAVADGVGTPAVVLDRDLSVVFANTPAETALGVSETLDRRTLEDALLDDDTRRVVAAVESALARARGDGGVESPEATERLSNPDDQTYRVEGIGLQGLDDEIDVEIDPFTVEGDPHALVVADGDFSRGDAGPAPGDVPRDEDTTDESSTRRLDQLE